jgi:hypothetical protein
MEIMLFTVSCSSESSTAFQRNNKKSGCSISWSCLYVHPQSERRSLFSEEEEEEEEEDKAILAARPRSKARSHREKKTWIISKENKNVQKN